MTRPTLLSVLLLVLAAGTASAHGGAYRGPLGQIPPAPHHPRGTVIPPSPGPPPPRKEGTRHAAGPMNLGHWIFWWSYQQDAILPEPSKRAAVSAETLHKRIEPALLRTVRDEEQHQDIRAGAILALARVPGAARHLPIIQKIAADKGQDQIVGEAALLALGLLPDQRDRVRGPLLAVVSDREAPPRRRCFAMVALGLLRDPSDEVFQALVARLDGSEPCEDVRVGAIYAMGLAGDRRRIGKLTEWLTAGAVGEAALGARERTFLVAAGGQIGDPAGWSVIRRGLRDPDPLVRRAAAEGAGRLLPSRPPAEQPAALSVLLDFRKGEKDGLAKNLALISMGRTAGDERTTPAVRVKAREAVRAAFATGDHVEVRPYAAFGLAMVRDPALATDIRPVFTTLRGDKDALGAQAIALGLLGDRHEATLSRLTGTLVDLGQNRKLRGAAAVALGLLGGEVAKKAILGAIGRRENRRRGMHLATAAGLPGDPAAVPHLLALMENMRGSLFTHGEAAVALGRIGGEAAVGRLIKILQPGVLNGAFPDLNRAMVTIALGRLAAPDGKDPLARLSDGFPWYASVSALDEILTIR